MVTYKHQKQHESNYNYNGKRSFGQRLKNFFTIPEEDLKEEPSKEFEKIKLFTLTRGSLFLGILVFMVLINILVGFNINFLYIRQISGFLFLILIPGLLIMLCLKIRKVGFWEYLVYTVGLSISFIMFAGLLVNWTLPALNITDKPLSLWPILICFDIFLLGLLLTAIYRNKDLKPFDITIPKLDTINKIFFIIPMAFPLLSILGAFLLNNHGPNILTMIMLGGIAIYVLLLVIFRKQMNENIWPWALYWMGLALVLMGSMRGWFISSTDASLEYHLSRIVLLQGHWNFWSLLRGENYSAMLSVTILPGLFSLFSKIPLILIIKLIFPLIFSIIFICIWKISRKILSNSFAFLATLFFLFQQTIVFWDRLPPRQEIAFLFLALIFLTILKDQINDLFRSVLFIIFSISLVVSHYSTTIIFLLCLIFIYLAQILFIKFDSKKIYKKISLLLILFLMVFSFFWYSQITNTSDSFLDFGKNSISNLGNLFKEEVYSHRSSPWELISVSDSNKYSPFLDLKNYTSSLEDYSLESKKLTHDYPSKIVYGSMKNTLFSNKTLILINLIRNVIIFLGRLLLIVGIILYFIFSKRSYTKDPFFFICSLVMFLLFCLLLILPFASINYNLDRLYCQMLIILSPVFMFGIESLLKKKSNFALIYTIFISIFLLNSVWFFSSFVGGTDVSMNLENAGREYDTLYVSFSEINSGNWLAQDASIKDIRGDHYFKFKLHQSIQDLEGYHIKSNVLPATIGKNDYVYSGNSNTITGITFKYYGRGLLTYNFPKEFLKDNKDKIYNNGGSEIFK